MNRISEGRAFPETRQGFGGWKRIIYSGAFPTAGLLYFEEVLVVDIQYLLWLQDFRNSIQDALTPFMELISVFAVDYLILIPVFFYWFQDKRKGLYPLVSYYFCMFLTPIIKLSACIYRPWIRDARILPAGDSMRTATGYSFPSGHTSTAVPLSGGMAVNLWGSKKTRWLSCLFVIFFLLTGFSRNYLGVHTPQDVFVAIFLSVLSLICTAKLMAYLDRRPERENWFLLGGFLLAWAGILYISLKAYPTDLDSNGKILVDPVKMMNDGYGDLGKVIGFTAARFVEKTWVRFRPLKKGWKSLLLCLIGLVPVVLLKGLVRPMLTEALGNHWGKLLFSVIHVFWFITLFPLILKLLGRAMKLDSPEAPKS